MVAEAQQWVDVEAAIRQWARETVTSVAERVYFGYSAAQPLPQIIVQRIGGPDQACLIQFDCWGTSKVEAAQIQATLATAIDALVRYTYRNVLLHAALVESVRWFPDEESDTPRYIIEALFFATYYPIRNLSEDRIEIGITESIAVV